MCKLENTDLETMRMVIKDEIMSSEESRYDHGIDGLLLVSQGFSSAKVANLLGHSTRTVQYWVKRFKESGFAGLHETERPGRPRSLDDKTIRAVASDLRKSTETFGYRQNLWDGKLLQHHLATRYGVDLGVRQCQHLFLQLGFRRRKPRPVIARSDAEAQRRYKKTAADGKPRKPDIWFEDECHFQQHGSRCTMWVPPEHFHPVMLNAPTRKSVGVYGAV